MSSPLVSVLLPVRDGGPYLAEAITSLRSQTMPDFEVIAVDDGSTDDSLEQLEFWAESDLRVRIKTQSKAGIVAALEAARDEARGSYLARMDADDIAAPARLERQLALLASDDSLVAVGCQVEYFPERALRDGARRYQDWINALTTADDIARDIFVECPLAHPTLLASARGVAEVGGYRATGWAEDYDLILRLWEAGGRFANVPEVLLRWRERADRLSRTDPTYSLDAFRRCKVHYLARTLFRGRDGIVVWGAGPTGKGMARTLLEAKIPLQAFVDLDPRKLGRRIYGAPVVPPTMINEYQGSFCLAAVAQPGAREEIRSALTEAGWLETKDFIAVA
jgi:glycosyltransferase involved in cell wall biosynthesis